MIRKILVVVVLLGFAWSYPPFRQRITLALSPVLEMLGPVGDMAAEPARRWKAESDIKFILSQFELEKTEGRQSPTNQREFVTWMARKPGAGEGGRDPWGTTYWLTRKGQQVTVGSNGPDLEKGTEDDIMQEITL